MQSFNYISEGPVLCISIIIEGILKNIKNAKNAKEFSACSRTLRANLRISKSYLGYSI